MVFAALEGRVAGPELGEAGGNREAEVTILQELCLTRMVQFEYGNDNDNGEAENS